MKDNTLTVVMGVTLIIVLLMFASYLFSNEKWRTELELNQTISEAFAAGQVDAIGGLFVKAYTDGSLRLETENITLTIFSQPGCINYCNSIIEAGQ